jgi:hypothetical protein
MSSANGKPACAIIDLDQFDGDFNTTTTLSLILRYIPDVADDVTPERFLHEAGMLLKNAQRDRILDGVQGFVGGLIEDADGNLQMQLIIFIERIRQRDAAYLADTVGMYWANAITDGDGRYENLNDAATG